MEKNLEVSLDRQFAELTRLIRQGTWISFLAGMLSGMALGIAVTTTVVTILK